VSYWDNAVLVDDDDDVLLGRIHHALVPSHPFALQDVLDAASNEASRATVEGKWRNRLMDVHALWCHLHYAGDVFVTRDGNFHRRREALAAVEPSLLVLGPCEAEAQVRSTHNGRPSRLPSTRPPGSGPPGGAPFQAHRDVREAAGAPGGGLLGSPGSSAGGMTAQPPITATDGR
jgi:hypothetical protein